MFFKIKWKLHLVLIILVFLISFNLYGFTKSILSGNSILNFTAQSTQLPKMKVVIDKFEEKYVVCEKEDKSMINIKHSSVPSEAKEGDVLNIDGGHISIAIEETKKKKDEISKLVKDLWK